jgi:hypothetical protein
MTAAIALAGLYDDLLAFEKTEDGGADAAIGDNVDLMLQRRLDRPKIRRIACA